MPQASNRKPRSLKSVQEEEVEVEAVVSHCVAPVGATSEPESIPGNQSDFFSLFLHSFFFMEGRHSSFGRVVTFQS